MLNFNDNMYLIFASADINFDAAYQGQGYVS